MTSRTKRNRIAGTTLAALACAPFCAHAAGLYLDASAGISSTGGIQRQELDDLLLESTLDVFDSFAINDSSLDKSDKAFSLALGYQLTPNFALEAAYLRIGKVRYEADVTLTVEEGDPPLNDTMGFTFSTSGPALSLVGIWPVGARLSVEARAGAYFSKTKARMFVESESGFLGSEDNTSLLLGVGATWSLTDKLGLRLGYTRLDKAVAGEGDADTLSLGFRLSL